MRKMNGVKFGEMIRWGMYVLLCVSFFFFAFSLIREESKSTELLQKVEIQGIYVTEDRRVEVPFVNYKEMEITHPKKLYIKGHFSKNIPEGMELMFYVFRENITISVNQRKIFHVDQEDRYGWEVVESPGISTEDTVSIYMEQTPNGGYDDSFLLTLEQMYAGSRYALLQRSLKENAGRISSSLAVIVVGIIMEIFALAFLIFHRPIKGFLSCGLVLIFGGLCCFIDYEYMTLLFPGGDLVGTLDYVCQMLLCCTVYLYLKCYIQNPKRQLYSEVVFCIWIIPMAIYFIMRGWGVIVEKDTNAIYAVFAVIILVIQVWLLLLDYRENRDRRSIETFYSGIFLTFFIIVEAIHYIVNKKYMTWFFEIGLTLFSILQLLFLIYHARESIIRVQKARIMEKELLESRINQMTMQIRPHFIYNVLLTIAALCERSPKRASEATLDFAEYLRGNLDSMTRTELIPFIKELEHLEKFFSLEELRFMGKINLDYHLDEVDFMLPQLSLEPFVENSIKYGVGKTEDILQVQISTKRMEKEIWICIQDNGPGFIVGEKKEDGRSHVGVENTRKRLKIMCGGDVEIESKLGVGTTVTIKIPM